LSFVNRGQSIHGSDFDPHTFHRKIDTVASTQFDLLINKRERLLFFYI